jgi:hypothetical protein
MSAWARSNELRRLRGLVGRYAALAAQLYEIADGLCELWSRRGVLWFQSLEFLHPGQATVPAAHEAKNRDLGGREVFIGEVGIAMTSTVVDLKRVGIVGDVARRLALEATEAMSPTRRDRRGKGAGRDVPLPALRRGHLQGNTRPHERGGG